MASLEQINFLNPKLLNAQANQFKEYAVRSSNKNSKSAIDIYYP